MKKTLCILTIVILAILLTAGCAQTVPVTKTDLGRVILMEEEGHKIPGTPYSFIVMDVTEPAYQRNAKATIDIFENNQFVSRQMVSNIQWRSAPGGDIAYWGNVEIHLLTATDRSGEFQIYKIQPG